MEANRSLGFSLHHLSFALDRQADLLLQNRFEIGFAQFKILIALRWDEAIRQREIASFLGQTEASVSRQIAILVNQGLVSSKRNPRNRRERITALTKRGEKVANDASDILEAYYAPMFESLSDKQLQNLETMLHQMHRYVNSQSIASQKERL